MFVLSGGNNAASAPMDVQSGATIEWTGSVQAEGYIILNDGCTAILHGTGGVYGVDTNDGSATQTPEEGRIRGFQAIEFRGPGTFTAQDSYRADFAANPTFTAGGAYSAQFTPRGAFQALGTAASGNDSPGDFPNIANVGLINDFVGDAFGAKPMSLRNIATAKPYNITHNSAGGNAPATLIYARMDVTCRDEDGNAVEALIYTQDQGAGSRTGSAALPTTISYRDAALSNYWLTTHLGNSQTVSTDVRTQLNRVLTYEWETETDGFNDIVTRTVSGGGSGGGNYTSQTTGLVGTPSVRHYRFSTDNNDTMQLNIAPYGFLTLQQDVNTCLLYTSPSPRDS